MIYNVSMQVVYTLMMQIKKKVYIPINNNNNNNNNFICIVVYTKALYTKALYLQGSLCSQKSDIF